MRRVAAGDAVRAEDLNRVIDRVEELEGRLGRVERARSPLDRCVVLLVDTGGAAGVQGANGTAYPAGSVSYTVGVVGTKVDAEVGYDERYSPLVRDPAELIVPAGVGTRGAVLRFPDGEGDNGEQAFVRVFVLFDECRAVRLCTG